MFIKICSSVLFLFLLIFVFLTFNNSSKMFVSRLIFSHDISLLTKTVLKKINENTEFDIYDSNNKIEAIEKIHNYMYLFFKPNISKIKDESASWLMLYGTVWCDGVSHIFIRLLEEINVRSYVVFLFDNSGRSHTLNFVDLYNNYNNVSTDRFYINSEIKNMYLYDTQNNYLPYNNDREYVDIGYLSKNKNEFQHFNLLNEPIDAIPNNLSFLEGNIKIFMKNRLPNEYNLISKISSIMVNIIPVSSMKILFKFGIYINPELDNDYKQFLYGRLDHIFFDYIEAKINYRRIINKNIFFNLEEDIFLEGYCISRDCPIEYNAFFWLNRLENKENNF